MENTSVFLHHKGFNLEDYSFSIFSMSHNITKHTLSILYVSAYKEENMHGNKNKSARKIEAH